MCIRDRLCGGVQSSEEAPRDLEREAAPPPELPCGARGSPAELGSSAEVCVELRSGPGEIWSSPERSGEGQDRSREWAAPE
eukprot:13676850-Alexandrium_andersonii.AAC.1